MKLQKIKNSKNKNTTIILDYKTYIKSDLEMIIPKIKTLKNEIYEYAITNNIHILPNYNSIIYTPIKEKTITLLKSPNVHKKAKEQFERSCHSLHFTITFLTPTINKKNPSTIKSSFIRYHKLLEITKLKLDSIHFPNSIFYTIKITH